MTDSSLPEPTVTVHPGGLSSTAHAVHALISVFTCGCWLPFYVVIALASRGPKTMTSMPLSTYQAQQAAAAATPRSVPQPWSMSSRWIIIGIVLAVLVGVFVCVLASLTR